MGWRWCLEGQRGIRPEDLRVREMMPFFCAGIEKGVSGVADVHECG